MDENIDFSKAFEQLQEMLSTDDGQSQIQNILEKFTAGSDKPGNAVSPSPAPTDSIDFNMISKLSGIMQAMSAPDNSAGTAFLNTLKPFLRDSRRKKLEQATKILKLATVFKVLKESNKGGD